MPYHGLDRACQYSESIGYPFFLSDILKFPEVWQDTTVLRQEGPQVMHDEYAQEDIGGDRQNASGPPGEGGAVLPDLTTQASAYRCRVCHYEIQNGFYRCCHREYIVSPSPSPPRTSVC
jgi:hypothetical protein